MKNAHIAVRTAKEASLPFNIMLPPSTLSASLSPYSQNIKSLSFPDA